MRKVLLIAAAFCLSGSLALAGDLTSCKTSPNLVGACFGVHGRVFISGGPRSFHIALPESRLVLDVLGREAWAGGKTALPAEVSALLSPSDSSIAVEGDYLVCPFDRTSIAHTRAVCIEAASHLSAQRR